MNFELSFTSVVFIMLDVALIWGCLVVDTHMKFLDAEEQSGNEEHAPRSKRISEYMH